MNAMNAIAARKEKGFTLIELVMVIVILGILAAFALPRFADLGGEAEQASVKGAQGAVKSASAIVRSKYLASGNEPESIELEGVDIVIVTGYASAASIADAAQLSSEFIVDDDTNPGVADISQGSCSFTYTQVGVEVEGEPTTAPVISAVSCD